MLFGQITVAVERGLGELPMQFGEQQSECLLLLGCSRVLGCFAILGTAADIADADAMLVVTIAVGTNLTDRPACMYAAVPVYQVVVADVAPVVRRRGMPTAHVLNCEVTAFGCGCAMANNAVNSSHGC